MQVENLQLVKRTGTAISVLRFLSQRERISGETALENLRHLLSKRGSINKDEFYLFFQDLETAGVGVFTEFNTNPRGKFKWKYSLRDVSNQILNPNKVIDIQGTGAELLQRRGRPKGSHPKPRPNLVARRKSTTNVILVVTLASGEFLPLTLEEAENMIKQVVALKAKLA